MFGCLFTLLNSDLKIWSAWFRYFICVFTQYKKPQGSISFNKKAHFFWLTRYFQPNLGFHTWIVSWNSYWDGATSHTTLWRKSWGSSTQCFGTASSAAKPRSTGSHTATASIPLIISSVTMPWFTCADESRRPLMSWRKPSKTLRDLKQGGQYPQKMQYLWISWKRPL